MALLTNPQDVEAWTGQQGVGIGENQPVQSSNGNKGEIAVFYSWH